MAPLKAVLILALLATLCGCQAPIANKVSEGREVLMNAAVCCRSIGDVAVRPLPIGVATEPIDAKSQAYDFETGKSLLLAYALPPFTAPYRLIVTSLPIAGQGGIAIFLPRIEFYDAQWRRTRLFQESEFKNRGDAVEKTLFINDKDAGERYVVIYSANLSAPIDQTLPVVSQTMIMTPYGGFFLLNGVDTRRTVYPSPTGSLRLEVQGSQGT